MGFRCARDVKEVAGLQGSTRTLPGKRGPFEVPAGRHVETDRLSKGISEDFRPSEPKRVASDSWERQPCTPD